MEKNTFLVFFTCLCFTLRCWVLEVFSRFGTVSPGLGDNYASKCGSGIFPHTKYMSRCMENSQNHTLLLCFSPILGRRFEKQGKPCSIVLLAFQTFSQGLEKNEATKCCSDNFPRTVTYILCVEKCQNHILMHSCLPIPGTPLQNVRKLHGLRISEWNLCNSIYYRTSLSIWHIFNFYICMGPFWVVWSVL